MTVHYDGTADTTTTSSSADNVTSDMHPRLQALVRQLTKKDVQTRAKAFSALLGLFEASQVGAHDDDDDDDTRSPSPKGAGLGLTKNKRNNDEDPLDKQSLLTLLPAWPSLYTRLSILPQRRLRTACQRLHVALMALAAGRRLLPHLKQLLPPWLASCHDSTHAIRALATAALEVPLPCQCHFYR